MSTQILHRPPLSQTNKHYKKASRKPRSEFIECPEKAVFLSGLQECDGEEYNVYRTKVYTDLQSYRTSNLQIYIKKLDFPKNRNMAYLHLAKKEMATHLKNLKSIKVGGSEVKVYEYNPNAQHQEEQSTPSLSGSDKFPVDGGDSGVNTCQVTRVQSPSGNKVDQVHAKDFNNSANEMLKEKVIKPSIMLPENFQIFYKDASEQILESAAIGIMNGHFSAAEFNSAFNEELYKVLMSYFSV